MGDVLGIISGVLGIAGGLFGLFGHHDSNGDSSGLSTLIDQQRQVIALLTQIAALITADITNTAVSPSLNGLQNKLDYYVHLQQSSALQSYSATFKSELLGPNGILSDLSVINSNLASTNIDLSSSLLVDYNRLLQTNNVHNFSKNDAWASTIAYAINLMHNEVQGYGLLMWAVNYSAAEAAWIRSLMASRIIRQVIRANAAYGDFYPQKIAASSTIYPSSMNMPAGAFNAWGNSLYFVGNSGAWFYTYQVDYSNNTFVEAGRFADNLLSEPITPLQFIDQGDNYNGGLLFINTDGNLKFYTMSSNCQYEDHITYIASRDGYFPGFLHTFAYTQSFRAMNFGSTLIVSGFTNTGIQVYQVDYTDLISPYRAQGGRISDFNSIWASNFDNYRFHTMFNVQGVVCIGSVFTGQDSNNGYRIYCGDGIADSGFSMHLRYVFDVATGYFLISPVVTQGIIYVVVYRANGGVDTYKAGDTSGTSVSYGSFLSTGSLPSLARNLAFRTFKAYTLNNVGHIAVSNDDFKGYQTCMLIDEMWDCSVPASKFNQPVFSIDSTVYFHSKGYLGSIPVVWWINTSTNVFTTSFGSSLNAMNNIGNPYPSVAA